MESQRKWRVALAFVLAGVGLSGCFDLVQTVGIDRSGAGQYQVAVSAEGIVGQAMKNEKLVDTTRNHAEVTTSDVNGKVTRTATINFKSLSELALSNETMSLAVTGHDLFGLGPAHVAFRATFMVDKAKNEQAQASANGLGEQIAQSVLGDHTYIFSVTVPGSVERASPLVLGSHTFSPEVNGDFYHGHTITWRVPLYALVNAQALHFDVDFRAYGFFNDSRTRLAENG